MRLLLCAVVMAMLSVAVVDVHSAIVQLLWTDFDNWPTRTSPFDPDSAQTYAWRWAQNHYAQATWKDLWIETSAPDKFDFQLVSLWGSIFLGYKIMRDAGLKKAGWIYQLITETLMEGLYHFSIEGAAGAEVKINLEDPLIQ